MWALRHLKEGKVAKVKRKEWIRLLVLLGGSWRDGRTGHFALKMASTASLCVFFLRFGVWSTLVRVHSILSILETVCHCFNLPGFSFGCPGISGLLLIIGAMFLFVLAFIVYICTPFYCLCMHSFRTSLLFDVSIATGVWGVCVCLVFLTITCLRVTATILAYDFCLGNALNIVLTYF